MMGSDISYEDYMEDPKLSNMYSVELVGEERWVKSERRRQIRRARLLPARTHRPKKKEYPIIREKCGWIKRTFFPYEKTVSLKVASF
jgi:hypothetical protein